MSFSTASRAAAGCVQTPRRPTALEASITEGLTDESLEDSIEASTGVAVEVDESSIEIARPTESTSTSTDGNSSSNKINIGSFGIYAAAAISILGIIVGCVWYQRKKQLANAAKNKSEEPPGEADIEMRANDAHKTPSPKIFT